MKSVQTISYAYIGAAVSDVENSSLKSLPREKSSAATFYQNAESGKKKILQILLYWIVSGHHSLEYIYSVPVNSVPVVIVTLNLLHFNYCESILVCWVEEC